MSTKSQKYHNGSCLIFTDVQNESIPLFLSFSYSKTRPDYKESIFHTQALHPDVFHEHQLRLLSSEDLSLKYKYLKSEDLSSKFEVNNDGRKDNEAQSRGWRILETFVGRVFGHEISMDLSTIEPTKTKYNPFGCQNNDLLNGHPSS